MRNPINFHSLTIQKHVGVNIIENRLIKNKSETKSQMRKINKEMRRLAFSNAVVNANRKAICQNRKPFFYFFNDQTKKPNTI